MSKHLLSDIEFGSFIADQSVGLVNQIRPLKYALAYLVKDAEQEFARIKERLVPENDYQYTKS